MLEGRTPDQKRELIKQLTDAMVGSIGVRPETVMIYINEVSKGNFGKNGKYRLDGVIP
jgi:4-oxalocrotonate tautomerase